MDRYESLGWIQITGMSADFQITVSKGRKRSGSGKGTAVTGYYCGRQLDFCGAACCQKWFTDLSRKSNK